MKRTSPATIAEEVRLLLRRNGIAVCIEWVKQSLEYLSRKGLTSSNPESLSAKVYLLFLEADLHEISSEDGIFPHNVQLIESGMLSSSNEILVLQVDEVVNVGSSAGFKSNFPVDDDENIPLKGPSAGSSRMLKMFLTDGRQQIIGIELRPMPSFSLEILPGTKVKLRASCTPMRRGVAMLSQECIVLLDGSVERLVAYTSTSGGACISAGSAHALQLPLQKSLPSAVGVNHPPFNQSHLIDPIQVRKFQQQQQQQQHQQQQQQQRPQIEVEKSLHRPLHEYQRLNPYSAPEHEYDSSTASRRNATVESNGERHQMDATVEHQSHNEITAHSRPLDNTIGSIRSVLISPGQPTTADILDLCSPSSPPPSSPRRVKIKPLPIPIRGMSLSATQGDFYGDLNGTTSPSTPSQGITMRNANIKAALAVNAVHTLPAIMKTSISNIKNGDAISAAGVSSYSGDQSRTECQSLSASALTYFALDVVAAWLSGLVGSQASCTLPAGDFAVRGTAVNIRKFKVVPSEGYVVLLSLEEEIEAKGENESKAIACVPALVSNKLCSKYLQTTAKEYLLNLKEASKEEIRAIKTSYSLKFRDFRGTFRARLQPCNSNSKISQSDPAVLDAQTGKSCSASSQGDRMLLLLVDFYCSEVT